MSRELRSTALRAVSVLPDLQYQQAVDNLAKIAANPGFLPYFAVIGHGSVQVTENGDSALSLSASKDALGTVGVGASRNVTGTWGLGTITSPEKIRGMQAVYLRALRGVTEGDPAFGWLKVGGKQDVPKHASYVGRYQQTRVWVVPEGIEGLSELTLAILDIATREDARGAPDPISDAFRGMADPPGMARRNFQVPAVGPVYTPGTR
jgi:hypothetical protein